MSLLTHTVPPPSVVPIITVTIREELDVASAPRVAEQLSDALGLRPRRLVVDLSRCDFLDATGVSMLVEAHRQAVRQLTELVLLAPGARLLRILALTGLSHVFTIEQEAA